MATEAAAAVRQRDLKSAIFDFSVFSINLNAKALSTFRLPMMVTTFWTVAGCLSPLKPIKRYFCICSNRSYGRTVMDIIVEKTTNSPINLLSP